MEWDESKRLKTSDNSKDAWRSSDGRLRDQESKKGETMKGYAPSDREKLENDVPKSLGGLESSYGNFSVGVNKKRQLVMVTSKKREKGISVPRGESKELNEQTSIRMPRGPRSVRVNGSRKEESAVEQRENVKRPETRMVTRMGKVIEHHHLDVPEQITPFLTNKPERRQLSRLKRIVRGLYQKEGKKDEKDGLQRHISELERVIQEKEQQKTRLYKRLILIRNEAKDVEHKEDWDFVQSVSFKPETEAEDDGREDETAGTGEDTAGTEDDTQKVEPMFDIGDEGGYEIFGDGGDEF